MIEIISNLIGGLGLLLIGMNLMTDGLKLASGNALRDILALWTNTRLRGLFSGFLITGIVQSSSAVTVATIGFANAEMLTLESAIWVIYGSNIGTTMTAWIVALIGFKVNVEALALPLIGLGALLKFTGAHSKRSAFGMALIGFGLLFLGISFLKATFDNLGAEFSLPTITNFSLLTILLFVLIGFLLTTVMQSSSAAMIIALSAAQSGVIPLNTAAALVIGANLGTTTTAIISVLGATSTAKRVAFSHVTFNLLTAIVAIIILSPMLWIVGSLETTLNLSSSPALTLAIFHSVFNILGTLLMWPISSHMVKFLNGRFTTTEEIKSKPKYLDKTVLALPYLAADAMAMEITRINKHTISAFKQVLQFGPNNDQGINELRIVRKLANEIGYYSNEINRNQLTPFLSEVLSSMIESTQQYLRAIDIAVDMSLLNIHTIQEYNQELKVALENFKSSISHQLDIQELPNLEQNELDNYPSEIIDLSYRGLKKIILENASHGELNMTNADLLLEYSSQANRASRLIMKATQRLISVRESLQRDLQGKVVSSDETDEGNITLLKKTEKAIAREDELIQDAQ